MTPGAPVEGTVVLGAGTEIVMLMKVSCVEIFVGLNLLQVGPHPDVFPRSSSPLPVLMCFCLSRGVWVGASKTITQSLAFRTLTKVQDEVAWCGDTVGHAEWLPSLEMDLEGTMFHRAGM